jgi:restriction system protein
MLLQMAVGWQRWQVVVSARRPGKANGFGKMVIRGLTAVYVLWLAYVFMVQPSWLHSLPSYLQEMRRLAEWGAGITLAVVWAALWWRNKTIQPPPLPIFKKSQLLELTPREFEQYVAELFRRKGYRVKLRGKSGDLGVDLEVINQKGRKAIVQCKRYHNRVGPEIVRELFGTMVHERAAHSFLVTSAEISDSAREWALGKPMTLIDGDMLVEIASALGVQLNTKKKPVRKRG